MLPSPMSAEPVMALAVLMPMSGLALASPTSAPPATAVNPQRRRSFLSGLASCSAPQWAVNTDATNTATHNHVTKFPHSARRSRPQHRRRPIRRARPSRSACPGLFPQPRMAGRPTTLL